MTYHNLALYIEPEKTIREAGQMMNSLFVQNDLGICIISNLRIDEEMHLCLMIEFDSENTDRVIKLVKEIGFKEDWDEMNEWEVEE